MGLSSPNGFPGEVVWAAWQLASPVLEPIVAPRYRRLTLLCEHEVTGYRGRRAMQGPKPAVTSA